MLFVQIVKLAFFSDMKQREGIRAAVRCILLGNASFMSWGMYVTRCPTTNTGDRCQSSVVDFSVAHESSGSSSTIIMVVVIAVVFLLVLVVSLVLAYCFMRRRRRYFDLGFLLLQP
jgi:hypothetical protein